MPTVNSWHWQTTQSEAHKVSKPCARTRKTGKIQTAISKWEPFVGYLSSKQFSLQIISSACKHLIFFLLSLISVGGEKCAELKLQSGKNADKCLWSVSTAQTKGKSLLSLVLSLQQKVTRARQRQLSRTRSRAAPVRPTKLHGNQQNNVFALENVWLDW